MSVHATVVAASRARPHSRARPASPSGLRSKSSDGGSRTGGGGSNPSTDVADRQSWLMAPGYDPQIVSATLPPGRTTRAISRRSLASRSRQPHRARRSPRTAPSQTRASPRAVRQAEPVFDRRRRQVQPVRDLTRSESEQGEVRGELAPCGGALRVIERRRSVPPWRGPPDGSKRGRGRQRRPESSLESPFPTAERHLRDGARLRCRSGRGSRARGDGTWFTTKHAVARSNVSSSNGRVGAGGLTYATPSADVELVPTGEIRGIRAQSFFQMLPLPIPGPPSMR